MSKGVKYIATEKLEGYSTVISPYKSIDNLPCSTLPKIWWDAENKAETAETATHIGGENHPSEVATVEGDEEGAFKFDSVTPGSYRILALGQVGWSKNVLWDDEFTVKPGKDTAMSVHSVRKICR